MASPRSAVALLGGVSVLLCSCGPSGGGAASSPSSNAPAVPSSATAPASAPPPLAAATPAAKPAPAVARRQPTAAELLRDDPAYAAKERALDALYQNARDRDPTGQVEREEATAVAERRGCGDKKCLDAWFRRREAALRQYVEN
jgi:hypothetical protein